MNNWEIKKLKYFLKVKHGKEQKLIEDKNGIYPILASGGEIGRTNVYLYDKPSVLIGRKGTIDKPQYIEQPFWTIDTLFYTKINDDNNAKFFYYLFQTINWHKYNEGSTIPSLNSTTIESIVVKVPPLEEQEKIVSILSKQDEVIEKLEKLIELKVRQKKGLMQRLLSGKLRLKGFSGEWDNVILDDVCKFYNGYAFKSSEYVKDGKYKIVTIANVQHGFLDINKINTINKLPKDISKHQILNINDIIFSMTGNVGRVCMINKENCLLNQRVGKIEAININKNFLYNILQDLKFVKKMEILAQGMAQSNLSIQDIKNYSVYISLDKNEQSAIASILSKCDEEIELLKKNLGLYRGQKKWLMEKLLSGEIRV